METEYIYWRHTTPTGIRVEEISGAEQRSGRVWLEMAKQVYSENGGDRYRIIDHLPSGAPILDGDNTRISVTHTDHLLVVASLPRTPEADLATFSQRTALGVDAERTDRDQVLRIRERFLSSRELDLVPADDLLANLLAWTAKEALYKAALTEGLDCRTQLRLGSLPEPLRYEGPEDHPRPIYKEGHATIQWADGHTTEMLLFAYPSDECIVTLAYSPKCAKFSRR